MQKMFCYILLYNSLLQGENNLRLLCKSLLNIFLSVCFCLATCENGNREGVVARWLSWRTNVAQNDECIYSKCIMARRIGIRCWVQGGALISFHLVHI